MVFGLFRGLIIGTFKIYIPYLTSEHLFIPLMTWLAHINAETVNLLFQIGAQLCFQCLDKLAALL